MAETQVDDFFDFYCKIIKSKKQEINIFACYCMLCFCFCNFHFVVDNNHNKTVETIKYKVLSFLSGFVCI